MAVIRWRRMWQLLVGAECGSCQWELHLAAARGSRVWQLPMLASCESYAFGRHCQCRPPSTGGRGSEEPPFISRTSLDDRDSVPTSSHPITGTPLLMHPSPFRINPCHLSSLYPFHLLLSFTYYRYSLSPFVLFLKMLTPYHFPCISSNHLLTISLFYHSFLTFSHPLQNY